MSVETVDDMSLEAGSQRLVSKQRGA